MWLRALIVGALIYLLYRLLRPRKVSENGGYGRDRIESPKEDVMVQDPACGTYIPRSQAIRVTGDAGELYFCSHECRERYFRDQSGG